LNGLVLINRFNSLKEEGVTNIKDRILTGTKERIRPIMLTATTDIFGFLPMAFSGSAGAEVQRPLATVVIGGMLTATFLTLVVLPVLYTFVEGRSDKKKGLKPPNVNLILVLLMVGGFVGLPSPASAQKAKQLNSLEEAISIGLANNGNVKVAKTNIDVQKQGKRAAFNPSKTAVGMQYGQYNSFENDLSFSIGQSFEFPTVYSKQRNLASERIEGGQRQLEITENELKWNIRQTWYELAYLHERRKLLVYQDTIYGRFLNAATIRYETEATSYLEKASAETQVMEVQNQLKLLEADIVIQEKSGEVLPLLFTSSNNQTLS